MAIAIAAASTAVSDAQIALAQDVMLNNAGSFPPRTIKPIDGPNPDEPMATEEEHSLEDGFTRLPCLAAARAAIPSAAINVQYLDNQMLPSLTLEAKSRLPHRPGRWFAIHR